MPFPDLTPVFAVYQSGGSYLARVEGVCYWGEG